ncbi:MAG: hypothetical protein FJ297_00275 [Planctomycetes bacterium]|nr:hypothetical protein [Planctomycetota bacterium]
MAPRSPAAFDPFFLAARREAWVIAAVWCLCLFWTIPYCCLRAYRPLDDPSDLTVILGMPDWVVWGIVAPWIGTNLFTIWFCGWIMRDGDLGIAPEDEPHDERTEPPTPVASSGAREPRRAGDG